MSWNKNPNHNAADEIADLSCPPSGGRVKMIVCGVVVPLLVLWFAMDAWIDQEAIWFGKGRGANLTVKGEAAKGLAVCWAGVAGFMHFRYFWGLWPAYRAFSIGVGVSMILGLGGCGAAFYHVLIP